MDCLTQGNHNNIDGWNAAGFLRSLDCLNQIPHKLAPNKRSPRSKSRAGRGISLILAMSYIHFNDKIYENYFSDTIKKPSQKAFG